MSDNLRDGAGRSALEHGASKHKSLLSQLKRRLSKKVLLYAALALASALLLAHLCANHFDGSKLRLRGEPTRRKRQAPPPPGPGPTPSPARDPFAGRPRISSRNGHLLIESSQDKNIEFRTGGSRGFVTLNGHKLDQLLGVARAFESSARGLGAGGESPLGANFSSAAATFADQYELLLRSLLNSANKLRALELGAKQAEGRMGRADAQAQKLARRTLKWRDATRRLDKRLETIVQKLGENNCLDNSTQLSVCKNGAQCVDLYDSYRCLCPAGWQGAACDVDVDECSSLRATDLGCQNGAKCVNLAGGYRCECPAQFYGVHCTERHDDCSLSSSGSLCGHGKCVGLARTERGAANYECICDQGWTTQPASGSPACISDVDECAAMSPAAANQTGQQGLAFAYPCSQAPFVECINLPGSFSCAPCPPGYSGNGRLCLDVDECRDGSNGGCSQVPLVECINLPGSRRCGPCPPGWQGDGRQCSRVPACQTAPNGGCHPAARCMELSGADLQLQLQQQQQLGQSQAQSPVDRMCLCQFPFTGQGVGPDGCQLDLAALGAFQQQQQLVPPQLPGWSPAGGNSNSSATQRQQQPLQPQQQDDCHPSPCLNGATCRIVDSNSFECSCTAGWTGPLCDERARLTCGGRLPASSGLFVFPPTSGEDLGSGAPTASSGNKWFNELLATLLAQTASASETASGQRPAAATYGKRMHSCTWSISGSPANMSLKLDLFNLANKRSPGQPINLLLFNQSSPPALATHRGAANSLACQQFEHLDLVELVADSSGSRRLVARLCPEPVLGSTPVGGVQLKTPSKPSKQQASLTSLLVESNQAELEYTFEVPQQVALQQQAASRRPLGQLVAEPVISFDLNYQPVEPACGGELPLATSGSLSSPRFPEFYSPGVECRYFVRVPAGNRIRLQFGELTLLSPMGGGGGGSGGGSQCFDSLTLYDGTTGSTLERPVLFEHCANGAGHLSGGAKSSWPLGARAASLPEPIVSSSSSVELVLSSSPDSRPPLMRPKQKHGFLLTFVAEPQVSGCGGLFTARSALIKSFDYEPSTLMVANEEAQGAQDELALAYEYARYFDQQRSLAGANQTGGSSNRSSGQANDKNSPSSATRGAPSAPLIRCEYEIRPGERARNHQIELNWLEMPRDLGEDLTRAGRWRTSRRERCSLAQVSLFERVPRFGIASGCPSRGYIIASSCSCSLAAE